MMRASLLAGLVVTGLPGVVPAAELQEIEVDRSEDFYELRSVARFRTDEESLYSVLTNYELFTYFTSAIVESRNLEPDEHGRPRYFTRMEGCVLMWCRSFVRSGHLELEPTKEIVAVADPHKSDFKSSHERWELVPDGDGTILVYEFEMIPDFWVPPIIGPFMIKRALRAGGEKALNRIEALAIEQNAR